MNRNAFLAALVCAPILLYAQQTYPPAPGRYEAPASAQGFSRVLPIWSEDFANGIPDTWTNEESGGIASWEFRGQLTDPSNEIGTRGSCIPEGAEGGAPIASPSAGNGFVIFDSNYWDNDENPCTSENFGTGQAPGPHLATLTSEPVDLSIYPNTALEFYQYLRHYQGETRVEMSILNGPWQVIFTNSYPGGSYSDTDDLVRIPLGAAASYASNVRFRFVFDGLYYFWQVDDIQVVEVLEDDLYIHDPTYGDFDLTDPAHPTGYEFMEYSQYPNEMPPLLKFSAWATNYGAFDQTDIRLQVEVLDENSAAIHTSASAEGFPAAPAESIELRAGSFQVSDQLQSYQVVFFAEQEETEDHPDDNYDTLRFRVTEATYARDRGTADGIYVPAGYAGISYEVGNNYLITADNMQAHSISVGVGIGSSTPSAIRAAIYAFDFDNELELTLVAITDEVAVTEADLNTYGEEKLITLPFNTPVPLSNGVVYFVSAICESGPDQVVFATSGACPEYTAWVRFQPESIFYMTRMPMVRLNFGPFVGITEQSFGQFHVYPNPARDWLSVQGPVRGESIDLKIVAANGQVFRPAFSLHDPDKIVIPTSGLSPGMYTIVVTTSSNSFSSRFMRE